jgi:hypothetical protein
MKDDGDPETITGWGTHFAVSAGMIVASCVGGAIKGVVQGKSFNEATNEVCEFLDENVRVPIIKAADKHSDEVVRTVVDSAAKKILGS